MASLNTVSTLGHGVLIHYKRKLAQNRDNVNMAFLPFLTMWYNGWESSLFIL